MNGPFSSILQHYQIETSFCTERELQNAMMTRDLLAVHMSVIRDQAAMGLSLLGELAQPAFKPWDVEDFKETLDVDCSYLQPYDKLMESLHDVTIFNLILLF